MILLIFLLAITLSSANPIHNQRQASDFIPCQDVVHFAPGARTSSKAELLSKECNDFMNSNYLVSRNQDSVLLKTQTQNDVFNGSDASAVQKKVNRQESVPLSLSGSDSSTSCDNLVFKENAPMMAAETIFQRDRHIKLIYFKHFNAIVPAVIAAVRLKDFFDTVAWQATNQWPTERPQSALFTITHGQFQLTMSCLGSTMPWPIVVSAAQRLSLLASGLCVSTFDAYWMEMSTSITVGMSFRLLNPHQPPHPPPNLHPRNLKPPANLHPRTPSSPCGTLSMTKFRTFTALIPTALIMSRLEDFYNIIATKIETGDFAHHPDANIRILMLWDFEFMVSCDKMVVPWSFVQAFAIDMAQWSAREFTGFYEATVRGEGPLTGLVFLVSMRLRERPGRGLH